MFIREKKKNNGKISIQIVEAARTGNKVSQHILRHVGLAINEEEVAQLKKLATSIIERIKEERQPRLPLFMPEEVLDKKEKKEIENNVLLKNLREEQRIIEGIGEIFGKLYLDLGFNGFIKASRKSECWNGILKSCVLARLANPSSKKRTASLLEEDYGIKVDLDKIYRMMDHLVTQEEELKEHVSKTTRSLLGEEEINILFFDVTTLYFESFIADDLRATGFSKDNKINETQIVFSLVTTTGGLPLSYEVFPGNTSEGKTLITTVKKLKKDFGSSKINLVADRAMFSDENLKQMEEEGIGYIVAAKLKTLPKIFKEEILNKSNYQSYRVSEEEHLSYDTLYKERRLIINYSSSRARKDAKDRERLVARLKKKINNKKVSLKSLIGNSGTKRYLNIKGDNEIEIDESKIDQDAKWDGLHGIITNQKKETITNLLESYHGLWQIEESFRINKHDLKMRPIFHYKEERIRAHLMICFISFCLAKQITYLFKIQQSETPMSFSRIREELLHVQASILVDTTNKKKYGVPSKLTPAQKKIYQVLGLKRSVRPYALS